MFKWLFHILDICHSSHLLNYTCIMTSITLLCTCTVKPVLSGHSNKDPKVCFKTDNSIMHVKSIAECFGSVMLSNCTKLPSVLMTSFCIFFSGRFRQGLLYIKC